jgi:LmbE family N-acetylglucosaminyl deacetylase
MMLVVAHPDDECFAFGGALALAADRGIDTYVICLTDGQAATHRGDAASGEELGRMRRREFVESCKILGVTRHELLDYQDGRLEFADFSRAAGRLVERMRRFKPDVVVTFGSDGSLNTHADHMIVSMLTTAAFHWSGRPKRYRKAAAFRAHTSQAPLMEKTKWLFEEHGDEEFYMLLASEAPQPATHMTDLFEGL